MRRRRAIIVINIFLAIVMIAFNNCGQPGEIRFDRLPTPPSSVGSDSQESGAIPVAPGGSAPLPPATPPPTVIPGWPKDPGSTPDSGVAGTKVEKTIVLAETLKADVLFVIDNSGSMAFEQASMSTRFPLFIRSLRAIDWRVGIITTDVEFLTSPTSDGQLQPFSNGKTFLDTSVPADAAEKMFDANIQRVEVGSGYEQGIFATYRFLEREQTSEAPFMREDASINVVFVSDANETPFFDADTGAPAPQKRNKPGELVRYLKSHWPMKKFQFHSIVVNENDLACLSQFGNEDFGIEYEKLSTMTNGVKGSVCAQDYGRQLLFLSAKIKDLVKEIELECEPLVDRQTQRPMIQIKHGHGGGATVEIERVEGKRVYLKGALPAGEIKLEYFCPSEMLSN